MAMNSLDALLQVFERDDNEIHVPEDLREKALLPLQRMLAFKK
jgi:quinolinate synthase